jgi:hypothetical protein
VVKIGYPLHTVDFHASQRKDAAWLRRTSAFMVIACGWPVVFFA